MKLKKSILVLLYIFLLAPFVYTIINIKYINNECIDLNLKRLTLNWAIGYDDFRYYMNIGCYIFLFMVAFLMILLYLKSDKLYLLVLSYVVMSITNILFVNKLIDQEVYVNQISSDIKNPVILKNMNIIYEIGKRRFNIANIYVYIIFFIIATVLMVFSIYGYYRKNKRMIYK